MGKIAESIARFDGETDRSASLKVVWPKSVVHESFREPMVTANTSVLPAYELGIQEQPASSCQELDVQE
ncbi:hypothetical protein V6N13_131940 [Hibiscus sabdariffa]